jgi:serine/threonine-protein kinase
MNPELLGGRYRVLRGLGQGGMARVVLAEDLSLGSQCALKIIHPHLSGNPELISRFRLELEVSRRLRHPGILEVCEFHEPGAGEPAFLSMEYLGGGDLKRRILREGPLPLPEPWTEARAWRTSAWPAWAPRRPHPRARPRPALRIIARRK